DRKSTRLNSSHVSTSYAVFCLKKKTRSQCSDRAARDAESGVHQHAQQHPDRQPIIHVDRYSRVMVRNPKLRPLHQLPPQHAHSPASTSAGGTPTVRRPSTIPSPPPKPSSIMSPPLLLAAPKTPSPTTGSLLAGPARR